MAFDLLVKPQIKMLEIPSQRCVELVYEELIKICHTCGSTELMRYPRLQGKLIEVVSELLRERLGPCSSYVESLIAIQRAYINTNHPNFLGAAAAMSSVISDKQEREKKVILAEERKKRERRRMKELNGLNGADTPEDEEEVDATAGQKQSRSLSPAMATKVNGSHSLVAQLGRTASPSRLHQHSNSQTARDSFLNYFFGKDGLGPPPGATSPTFAERSNNRHVSTNIEPTFASSIRRGDTRAPVPEPIAHEEGEPLMVS
jgi:dynamin 1-like protein